MTRLTSFELCSALATRVLEIHYQPIATWSGSGTWEISSVEALLRCQRANGERVAPDRLLPVAERAGLIGQLTHYVLTHALGCLQVWDRLGLRLQAAINLHVESLTDPGLADKVLPLIEAHGIEPRRVTLEISERTPIVDLRRARLSLSLLRARGVRVALDDFGTGFSLFTRIDTLPCDVIKIDKSLVFNMAHSQEAENAIGALIELGHARGIKVCAEGVEHVETLEKLGNLDCDSVQGYLLSPALRAERVRDCLQRWHARTASRTSRNFYQPMLPGIPALAASATLETSRQRVVNA